jgi:hypothetical protein
MKLNLQINLLNSAIFSVIQLVFLKNVILHFEIVLSACADLVGKPGTNHGTNFATFRKEVLPVSCTGYSTCLCVTVSAVPSKRIYKLIVTYVI